MTNRINRMFCRFFLIFSSTLLIITPLSSLTINGVIKDGKKGKPLENAVITVKNDSAITWTNGNGQFSINAYVPIYQGKKKKDFRKGFLLWGKKRRTIYWNFFKKPKEISLFSLKGQKLILLKPSASSGNQRVPSLAPGFYTVHLKFDDRLINKKIIMPTSGFIPVMHISEKKRCRSSHRGSAEITIFRDGYNIKNIKVYENEPTIQVFLEPDKSHYVFNPFYIRTYEFNISPKDLEWMNNNVMAEEYVAAEFVHNGKNLGEVGIRYKGAYSLVESCDKNGKKNVPKISFKVKFNKYHDKARFHGLKCLNLHSMKDDDTYIYNKLAYHLFSRMGVLTPRTAFCKVYINGEYEGLFSATEEIDGRFTKNRFPDYGNGNLYKEAWPCIEHRDIFLKKLKTNNGPNDSIDVSKMYAFQEAIDLLTTSNFRTQIVKWVDYYNLMRYITVDRAISNSDGIMIWYHDPSRVTNHNYYWYEEENNGGKFWLIPWDLDYAFSKSKNKFETFDLPRWYTGSEDTTKYFIGGTSYARAPARDKLINLLAQTGKDIYNYYGNIFLNNIFTKESIQEKLDEWKDLIDESVKSDPNGIEYDTWKNNINYFRSSLSFFRNMFKHYKQYPSKINAANIPSFYNTTISTYNGLSTGEINTFETSSQINLFSTISANSTANCSFKIAHNQVDPISGNYDIVDTVIYQNEAGVWSEWSNLIFQFKGSNTDLSVFKYIALDMKSDSKRSVRITIGSSSYPASGGILYGWDATADTVAQTVILPLYKLSYPTWGYQDDVLDEVLKSVTSMIFEPFAKFDSTGELSVDPDTCILHIDNIRFIE